MRMDINTASVYELERTFHNRERAQEVLNKREQFGDFKNWEDLRERVHGISDRLIRELSQAGLIVGAPSGVESLGRRPVRQGRAPRSRRAHRPI
jgi:Helix-hairpin-helix motif